MIVPLTASASAQEMLKNVREEIDRRDADELDDVYKVHIFMFFHDGRRRDSKLQSDSVN